MLEKLTKTQKTKKLPAIDKFHFNDGLLLAMKFQILLLYLHRFKFYDFVAELAA